MKEANTELAYKNNNFRQSKVILAHRAKEQKKI